MTGIILFGSERKSIVVETRLGNPVDNYQIIELSQFERNQFVDYSPENYPLAVPRNSPSPMYNCHGMSFASRRTNIDESTEIRKILTDDGYKKIDISLTKPGDIVLYIDLKNGHIAHSGILCHCEHPKGSLALIYVISKWGKYREFVHEMNNCPYKNYNKEFYRLCHTNYE